MKRYLFCLFLWGVLGWASAVLARPAPPLWEKKIQKVLAKVRPAFVSVGGGSGVLISPDGYLLTNHHVTRGKVDWWVSLPGGKVYRAKLIGYDPRGDLALLKILHGKNLPYVEFGDSQNLKVGTPVIALGNPWGLAGPWGNPSVTFGFVSAVHRYQGGYGDCFQIDAPINPGNSGGPTFDLSGKLLGINGQIRTRFALRVFSGIGLAIPVHQIRRFLPLLKRGGEVSHGQLPKGLRFSARPDRDGAVFVEKASLDPSCPLKKGDRLLRIAGLLPLSHSRVLGIVSTYPPGTKLTCVVERQGRQLTLQVPIKPVPTYAECLAKGIPFRYPHHPYLGLDFGPAQKGGVVVTGVIEHSPAASAGVVAGDILLSFNGVKVKNKWMVESLLSGTAFGEQVQLVFLRGNQTLTLTLTVGNTDDYPIEKYKSRWQPKAAGSSPSSSPSPPPSDEGEEEEGELTPEVLGLTLEENDEGEIVVVALRRGSLAEKYGFQKGDVVVQFQGEDLEDLYDLETKLLFCKKGDKLRFQLRRKKLLSSKSKKVWEERTVTVEFVWKEE